MRVVALLLLFWGPALAATAVEVTVADPYLELHTGPGRGYPVFHVVERGATVEVSRRRTDWFEVRGERGSAGWVHREQLERTLRADGNPMTAEDASFGSFSNRRFEIGVLGGDFGGADVISVYGAYALSPHLSVELAVSQGLGSFSDSAFANLDVVHQLFPEKRISPLFALGTGIIRTSPNATLVETEDRTDQSAHVGLGVRAYLTRQFVLRVEYRSYVVFTSRDENEEVDEWKAGFSFFLSSSRQP